MKGMRQATDENERQIVEKVKRYKTSSGSNSGVSTFTDHDGKVFELL
jgi:hypothetical protein